MDLLWQRIQHHGAIGGGGGSCGVEDPALIKVYGVGQLTALTYVLTLGSKGHFEQSRDVGCYLGLRPRRRSVELISLSALS